MEFHIKVLPNGEFSQWLATTANIGDTLMLQGPFGSCIYSGDAEQTMLLAATGTGLAPILGIARDALAQQHSGDIQLVVAANSADDLYLVDELKVLAASHEQIKLHFVLRNAEQTNSKLEAEADDAMFNADVYAWCKQQWPTLKGWRIFLCGNTSFVGKMRKQCFMSGANMRDISSDIFLPFGQPMA
ncbi:hypothetical protein GYB62_00125 [bacterium]|nr:hypothetical protein [bacterium]